MKILVVRLSSLGDILHFFPAVTDLQRHYPEAEIHWLIEPAFAELAGWHDAVKKVITVPLRAHKKTWWKLPGLLAKLKRELSSEHYDLVLDGQGLLKSALLARLTGAQVFGFDAASARESLAAKLYQRTSLVPTGLHIIEKNRRLVQGVTHAQHELDAASADFGLANFRAKQLQQTLRAELQLDQPYVVLLHGTTWNSKYWPESSWFEFVGLLAAQGYRCVLPWGNEAELQRAQRLQQAGGDLAIVLPKCNLHELSILLLRAQFFVAVETGIGHLAALLDVPGVMLHGPTDPNYSGILGKNCEHIVSGIDCSPCFKRNCPRVSEAVPPCQQLITPQQVLHKLLKSAPFKLGNTL